MSGHTLGLVACAAGGVEDLVPNLIEPLTTEGWTIAVTLTPTAATWLTATGQLSEIERVTGLPVRHQPRLPGERSPHPPIDCHAVVPATANTVAKLALGLADNQALTQLCEALGGRATPIVVFPRINAAHADQPAWETHIARLRSAGVHLVYGDEIWPLRRPRQAPDESLPWVAIRAAVEAAAARSHR